MRRKLIIAASVIAVIILVLLVAGSLVDLNKYKPRIQSELETKLGRPVQLGDLHLRLLPLSVRIDGVTINESPAFSSPHPFAKANEVYASVGLFSLISGSPKIGTINLTRPQIEIIRNAQGVWNFSTLGQANKAQQNQPAPAPSSPEQQNKAGNESTLTLDELKITDGQVALTDQLKAQSRSVYDHIDAEVTNFAPRQPFNVELSVHLPGEGKQVASLNAKVGPMEGVETTAIPINGHFKLEEVSLAGINRFASGSIPPNTNTVVSGDGNIESANETITAKGDLKLKNTTVRGVKIDYPINADFDVSDNRRTDLLTIRSGNVKLGATPIAVSGTIDSGKKPADLDVKLQAKNASMTELARLAGAFGMAFNPAYQVKGTLDMDVAAKGPQNSPQLNGTVQARQLEASGGEIKQPVSVPEIDLALTPTEINSKPFIAKSGSTQVTVGLKLAQYTSQNPNVDATVKTNSANIAELLDMAKAYGASFAQGASGSGKLSLDARVQGPLKQTDKLVYSGSGTVSNAVLNTPELTKPLNVRSANLRLAQNGAAIDGLSASIGSTDLSGSLSAKNLAAPQVQFALSSNKLDVGELQSLQAENPSPSPATSNAGSASSKSEEPKPAKTQPAPKPAAAEKPGLLAKTTGGGTLSVGTLVAEQIVLTNVKATAKLDRGLISLSPVTANVFGGNETGTIAVNTRPATPTCSVKSKLAGVDTNQLLSAVSSVKDRLTGSLSANADLNFALVSGDALARTLNGSLTFDVANGQLKGVNILGELSKIGKFLGAAPGQGGAATAIKKLGGTLNVTNGVANTNNLVAVLNEGSLSANGSLNLVNQGINMHATAVLSNGISQTVGGSKVGGFLNTALANKQGELVLPVLITGTLDKPMFAPDAQAMAQMKLKNLLPTSGNPAKLSSGIIGSVLGQKGGALNGILGGGQQGNQQQANPQQGEQKKENQPKDVINGIFDRLNKRKK